VLKQHGPGFVGHAAFAYAASIAASLVGVFVFLLVVYRVLPNTRVTTHEALPGAIVAAIVLEASFQVIPFFVRLADVSPTLRTLGGPAILLLWLYVMANVTVFGAELNWWLAERRRTQPVASSQPAPSADSVPAGGDAEPEQAVRGS
jgi:uncharacterized BrkB/YihY/UPF0761 family membrane protein